MPIMSPELIKLEKSEVCFCCNGSENTHGSEVYQIENLSVNVQLCEVCLTDLDDEITTKLFIKVG